LEEQPLANLPDVHWYSDVMGHRLADSQTAWGHLPAQEKRAAHSLTSQQEKQTFVLFQASGVAAQPPLPKPASQ
jgi:hypothetical protein